MKAEEEEEVNYLEVTAGFHKRGEKHPAGGYTGAVIGTFGVENPLWRGGELGDGTEQIGDDEYEDTTVAGDTLKAEYDFTEVEEGENVTVGASRVEVLDAWIGGVPNGGSLSVKLFFVNPESQPITFSSVSEGMLYDQETYSNSNGDLLDLGPVEKIEIWVDNLSVRINDEDEKVGNAGAYMRVKATLVEPLIDRIEWALGNNAEMEGPAYIPWDETVELTAIPVDETIEFGENQPEWTLEHKPDDSELDDDDIAVVSSENGNNAVVTFSPDYPGLYTIKATVDDSEAEIDIYAIRVEMVFAHHLSSEDDGGDYEFCSNEVGNAPETTLLFVNRADMEEDERPDFASEQLSEDTGILKKLILHICPPEIDWDDEDVEFSLTFAYLGDEALPDFDGAATVGTGPDGTEFKDYISANSGFRDATIRLWGIDQPTESRNAASYVVPDETLTIGGSDAPDWLADFEGTRTFYAEGISEAAGEVKVTLTVHGTEIESDPSAEFEVVEPYLWLNASNNSNQKRSGVPSVDFTEIEEDFIVKDQGEGFVWWVARYVNAARIDRFNIVDLIPMMINIPESASELDFYLQPGIPRLHLFQAVSDESNRLAFIQDEVTAESQRSNGNSIGQYWESQGETLIDEDRLNPGNNELVFFADPYLTSNDTQIMYLFVEDPITQEAIPIDSFRITIKDVEEFWTFVSARGNKQGYNGPYPTEDGRFAQNREWYGEQFEVSNHPGSIDHEKSNVLIWLHGFNVTESQALENYSEIFRRLYLLGYRGNFVGFTWEGDTGGLIEGGPITTIRFDPDVEDSLYSAPSLRNYLLNRRNEFGAENINIVSHSLGNVVMWEALRLDSALGFGANLVNNIGSFQAAVKGEAFDNRTVLFYRPDGSGQDAIYPSASSYHDIEYTWDQQMQHTWRFWFNNPNAPISNVLSGGIYNSYVKRDFPVYTAKRLNDYFWRGIWAGRNWHYERNLLESENNFRSPMGGDNAPLYNRAPMIMNPRVALDWHTDLNLALGSIPNPIADSNLNAETVGWRSDEHRDYLNVDSEMWFPKIYSWWDSFLGAGNTVEDKNGLNIIPLGEE